MSKLVRSQPPCPPAEMQNYLQNHLLLANATRSASWNKRTGSISHSSGEQPEHTVTRLPELRLKIKENLDESLYPFAVKALWWIKRFFPGEMPKIANGLLFDAQGIRDPQEEKRLILSEVAIQRHKEEVRQQIKAHETELAALDIQIGQLRKQQHTLTQALTAVKEAESFQTTVHERTLRQTKFQQFTATKEQLLQKEKDLQQQLEQLSQPIVACNWIWKRRSTCASWK